MRAILAAVVALLSPPAVVGADPPARPPQVKAAEVGRHVAVEVQGPDRRVVVDAEVCLREGALEQLLCRYHTKEHEAILRADIDARDLHKALLVAGAKPGSPVRFEPKFRPPTGSRVRITLEYEDQGARRSIDARQWVRDAKTRKPLEEDWVFAGSVFFADPRSPNGPPLYAANGGDVICVANFEGALLDLPLQSTNQDAERLFEAFTERIPPVGTKVKVMLEPLADRPAPGPAK